VQLRLGFRRLARSLAQILVPHRDALAIEAEHEQVVGDLGVAETNLAESIRFPPFQKIRTHQVSAVPEDPHAYGMALPTASCGKSCTSTSSG
jgi:hypothetical protein